MVFLTPPNPKKSKSFHSFYLNAKVHRDFVQFQVLFGHVFLLGRDKLTKLDKKKSQTSDDHLFINF